MKPSANRANVGESDNLGHKRMEGDLYELQSAKMANEKKK